MDVTFTGRHLPVWLSNLPGSLEHKIFIYISCIRLPVCPLFLLYPLFLCVCVRVCVGQTKPFSHWCNTKWNFTKKTLHMRVNGAPLCVSGSEKNPDETPKFDFNKRTIFLWFQHRPEICECGILGPWGGKKMIVRRVFNCVLLHLPELEVWCVVSLCSRVVQRTFFRDNYPCYAWNFPMKR